MIELDSMFVRGLPTAHLIVRRFLDALLNPLASLLMQPFRLVEREISPQAREIGVEGELDLAVAARLQDAIGRCDAPLVVIDLGGCEFIDSTGIAVIVQAYRERAGDGGRVVVHSARDQVLRVLDVTGLTENELLFEDRDGVLAAAGDSGNGSAGHTR